MKKVVSLGVVVGAVSFHLSITNAKVVTNLRNPATSLHVATTEDVVLEDDSPGSDANATPLPYTYTDDAQKDRITDLPGLDYDPGFNQFAGYLTVSKENRRNIFYWYVESQGDPAKDPVVYWTNGGPGCSGMLGFGTEHGPYYIDKSGKLSPNKFSWNKVASMLYVEQPAGVGFSYSETPEDYTTGDKKAAADNFMLIKQFLERFPERKANEFYIASESYGGHYIPQLTKEILNGNTDGAINFRGFLVGNPYVDPFTNRVTSIKTYYQHGLIAKPLFDLWQANCEYRDVYDSERCQEYEQDMFAEAGEGINPYAMDYPVCTNDNNYNDRTTVGNAGKATVLSSSETFFSTSSQVLRLINGFAGSKIIRDGLSVVSPPFLPPEDQYKPCAEVNLNTYLNRDDVKNALHVAADKHWDACSGTLDYSGEDIKTPQIDLYKELISMAVANEIKLNMMVFSGDDDSVCSTAGTQAWIYDLGVNPQKDKLWIGWKVHEQTAGFVTHFDLGETAESTFTFATVHGAGHEVPAYRPMEALEMFKLYFSGEW